MVRMSAILGARLKAILRPYVGQPASKEVLATMVARVQDAIVEEAQAVGLTAELPADLSMIVRSTGKGVLMGFVAKSPLGEAELDRWEALLRHDETIIGDA